MLTSSDGELAISFSQDTGKHFYYLLLSAAMHPHTNQATGTLELTSTYPPLLFRNMDLVKIIVILKYRNMNINCYQIHL